MGFYIRKSISAGPFRFNLSKSGLGVSTGVRGFRVGSGPRGNYVHMGRHGVYYRATLGSTRRRRAPQQQAYLLPPEHPQSPTHQYDPSDVIMADVTGATAVALVPTGSGDLVEQLNAAATRFRWDWPLAIGAFLLGLLMMRFGVFYGLITWLVLAALCWWMYLRGRADRTVVLFYDVHDAQAVWFESLVANWPRLSGCHKLWRVVRSGQVVTTYQFKVNAGASDVVNRIPAAATTAGPKHLATNVAIPSLVAGSSSLHFLPDRVLLRDGKRYSDVGYQHLRVFSSQLRFTEGPGAVPGDGTQVGQTWQFVNVRGGPDRRYTNNPIRPIMLYGELFLGSAEGLNWRLHTSRADAAPAIAAVLTAVPAIGSK